MSPPVPTGPILTAPPVSGPFGYGGPFADQILGGPGGCSGNGCVTSPWYVGVEALAWWIESYDTPPLVTVGPATSGAFLTSPGANIAYGLNPVDTNPRYGARLTLGRWLNPKWAVELTAFYVRPRNDVFDLSSAQVADADLARPFFSLNTLTESSEIIGRPGVAVGSVHIESKSQIFGAELNARKRWWENCNNRIDLIAGVRYLYLEESLTITERVAGLAGATGFEGVAKQVEDRFTTKNRFWGAQIGAIFQHTRGPWTFELKAKVAAGVNREYTDVDGGIVPVVGGVPPGRPGGLLALASNIGEQRKDVFSWVPEVGLNVGYDVNSHCRVFLGYSVLYWSHAARPGNQIDPRLDENLIPYFPAAPPAQGFGPTPRVESESVWVQGVNFGVLFKW